MDNRSWDTFCTCLITLGVISCFMGGAGLFLSYEFNPIPFVIFIFGIIIIVIGIKVYQWSKKDDDKKENK